MVILLNGEVVWLIGVAGAASGAASAVVSSTSKRYGSYKSTLISLAGLHNGYSHKRVVHAFVRLAELLCQRHAQRIMRQARSCVYAAVTHAQVLVSKRRVHEPVQVDARRQLGEHRLYNTVSRIHNETVRKE
jgi:hypothetical protein